METNKEAPLSDASRRGTNAEQLVREKSILMKATIAILLLGFGLFYCAGRIGTPPAAVAATLMESEGQNISAGAPRCSPDLDAGCPAGWPEDFRNGATRVDRDLYPFHYGDTNQFGDDEAYNSMSGKVHTGVRFPIHREDP
jgi:hypothetical protein